MCGFLFGLIIGALVARYLARDQARYRRGWSNGKQWARGVQQRLAPLVVDNDYALFQQWKRQQRMTSGGATTAGPAYNEPPAFDVAEVKNSAVETVDKALDVLLMQVQGLKKTLAQHKVVIEEEVVSASEPLD